MFSVRPEVQGFKQRRDVELNCGFQVCVCSLAFVRFKKLTVINTHTNTHKQSADIVTEVTREDPVTKILPSIFKHE